MNPTSFIDADLDKAFFDTIYLEQILAMFDLFPDTICWVKNKKGQIMYANQPFVTHIGVKSVAEVLGKTDFDFSPPHIAKQFVVDDQKVMAGKSVTERLEINQLEGSADVAWFVTSKRPLMSKGGEVIGSYGMSRQLDKNGLTLTGLDAVSVPVEYIRENFMQPLMLAEVAAISHLSISALERRFKKYLNITPKQFISQVRLEHARKLLIETNLPISDVAHQSGFSDNSYFSRQFMAYFDELPSHLRKKYQTQDELSFLLEPINL